jgi:hypothetical protein
MINLLPDSWLVSLICHALLTCLILASLYNNLAFIDHHLGPWFKQFIFIKDCTRKPGTKIPNLPETSKQHHRALLAHLGELTYLPRWVGYFPRRVWRRAYLQNCHFARLGISSNLKTDIFILKTSNQASPNVIWPLGSLETCKTWTQQVFTSQASMAYKWGN